MASLVEKRLYCRAELLLAPAHGVMPTMGVAAACLVKRSHSKVSVSIFFPEIQKFPVQIVSK